MDDKFNYAAVGAFVLALGAALVVAVLWLAAGFNGKKQVDLYQSIIQESVAGLNLDAPVKYLGVDVGKVSRIGIDPGNTRQVRLVFSIDHGTPIRQDTEAMLKTQGLTGIAYVELSSGSAGSPPLVMGSDGAIPTIRSKPSLSARLENVATAVLGSIDRVSTSLNTMLDADNRAALKQTLADAAALMHALAAQRQTLATGIADAARTARNTSQASAELGPAIERVTAGVNRSAEAVDQAARAVTRAGDGTTRAAETAASGVQQLRAQTLPELARLLAEANQLAASLRRLSEQTERSPSSLITGRPARPLGPGETVNGGASR